MSYTPNPDQGERHRRSVDPNARELIRRIRLNGSLQTTTLGQMGYNGDQLDRFGNWLYAEGRTVDNES